MQTRSRTVQPKLKESAEQFLAKAEISQTCSSRVSRASRSKKRKLQDVGGLEEPAPSALSGAQKKDLKENLSSINAPKKLPSLKSPADLDKTEPSSSVMKGASRTELEQLASTQESTQNSRKLKSPEEADVKRLKRYRKQAPRSYLQKLHRSQTQR